MAADAAEEEYRVRAGADRGEALELTRAAREAAAREGEQGLNAAAAGTLIRERHGAGADRAKAPG